MGLSKFLSVVRCAFATGVTKAWQKSSGICEVWREGMGGMCGLKVLRALRKKLIKPVTLLGLRVSRAHWVSDSVMSCFAMCVSVRG